MVYGFSSLRFYRTTAALFYPTANSNEARANAHDLAGAFKTMMRDMVFQPGSKSVLEEAAPGGFASFLQNDHLRARKAAVNVRYSAGNYGARRKSKQQRRFSC
jgi:hypothetical protein